MNLFISTENQPVVLTKKDEEQYKLSDEETEELISILKGKLLKSKANFEDSDAYYLGLIKKLQVETAERGNGSLGNPICVKGRLGRKLYIIKEGEVDVMADDDKTVRVTLDKGA
jgi:hypothetical protein